MKNEIRTEGEVVIINVLHKKTGKMFEAKCDIADMTILQRHYWVMSKNATSVVCNYRQNGKMVNPSLHKVLTGSRFVKFLNGDKLDFRENNLQPTEKRFAPRPTGVSLKSNPYFVHDEGITFFITDRKGKKTGLAFIVDHDDLEKVLQYTWHINSVSGYVQTRTREGRENSKSLYLHRLIMNAQSGDEIDHINQQKTDNRKKNLRLCTRSQNMHNAPMHRDNVVGAKGISPTQWGTWKVQMQINHKRLCKIFPTFAQAVAQRKAWEEEYKPSGLHHG